MTETADDASCLSPCPLCAGEMLCSVVGQEIEYRSAGSVTLLRVNVPVESCPSCGYEGYGEAGERVRTEAVYRYLGRLTPWDIVAIRERLSLSQSSFADWLGVGRASLERWERGTVMHNQSMDNLIVAYSDRFRKAAIDRERSARLSRDAVVGPLVDLSCFRALRGEDAAKLESRRISFRLHTTG